MDVIPGSRVSPHIADLNSRWVFGLQGRIILASALLALAACSPDLDSSGRTVIIETEPSQDDCHASCQRVRRADETLDHCESHMAGHGYSGPFHGTFELTTRLGELTWSVAVCTFGEAE